MDTMTQSTHALLALTTAALVTFSATACTTADTASPSPSASSSNTPVASPTPTPTATSGAVSAVDPTQPHDPDDMNNWADGITTSLEGTRALAGITTHLGPDSSTQFSLNDGTLAPGSYSYYFACRGDGDITMTISNAGAELTTLSGACSGDLQGGNFSTSEVGTDFVVTSMDAPVDVVLRVTDALPS
jgi:hypothetical protein